MLNLVGEYIDVLTCSLLFKDQSVDEIMQLLDCANATLHSCKKNDVLIRKGQTTQSIYVTLEGKMKPVYSLDRQRRHFVDQMEPGWHFGFAYAILQVPLHVDLLVTKDSKILKLDCYRLANPCHKNCSFHYRCVKNISAVMAKKCVMLAEKIEYMHARTVRGALVAYLLNQFTVIGINTFTIELNRTELSDYLGISRFSLVRELNALQLSGLIEFQHKAFRILDLEGLKAAAQDE